MFWTLADLCISELNRIGAEVTTRRVFADETAPNNVIRQVGSGLLGDDAWITSHTDAGLPIHTTAEGYLYGTHNVFVTNLSW